MSKKVTPLFLISLPRSGSTLLQRCIMSQSDVDSFAELWTMLPLVYIKKSKGVKAIYGHRSSLQGLERATSNFGEVLFDRAFESFVDVFYSSLTNKKYFLDKTPRYHLILNELYEKLPHAKFIVLVRNPLSVYASSLESLILNKLSRIHDLDIDVINGPDNISMFCSNNKSDRIHIVKYEDLITRPLVEINSIYDFLSLDRLNELPPGISSNFIDGFDGQYGIHRFSSFVSRNDHWATVLNNRARVRLAEHSMTYYKNYCRSFGYNYNEILDGLRQRRNNRFFTLDYFKLGYSNLLRQLRNYRWRKEGII